MATNIAIQHPNIFYFVLDANWSSINSLEFWNKGNTVRTNNNNQVYKTIYSPSLVNYAEPRAASFIGFTTTGGNAATFSQYNVSNSYNKGWNFYCQPNFIGSTIFFSALGFRDVYSGSVNISSGGSVADVSGGGYYWSAGPSSTAAYARLLFFYSGYVSPLDESFRAYGFSLRPASE